MITQWLTTIPLRQRITLLLVMIGLIFSGFYAMVWDPTSQEMEALLVSNAYLAQEIERQKERRADLVSFEEKAPHERIPSPTVQEAMAVTGLDPGLLRREVQTILRQHGLLLAMWQPTFTDLSNSMNHTVRVQGRIEGHYHEIAKGFEAILKMPWVLEVDQLRLSITNDRGILSTDFQLVGLVSTPPESLQKTLTY
ncbi:MAG: hypothetical protein MRJ96_02715 [Nitrospirales bacterium]|nr:hypothetical protein [Nitrospira sp.]MDR4500354.1 hypothetical protein [Nitrospirales bacterium]